MPGMGFPARIICNRRRECRNGMTHQTGIRPEGRLRRRVQCKQDETSHADREQSFFHAHFPFTHSFLNHSSPYAFSLHTKRDEPASDSPLPFLDDPVAGTHDGFT